MRRRPHPRAALPIAGAARHLVAAAAAGHTVTHGHLARECGGSARGQGRVLATLAERCARRDLPILPVLAVIRATCLPTVRAPIYQRLGLTTRGAILAEQRRCFAHDWTGVTFEAEETAPAHAGTADGRNTEDTTPVIARPLNA